MYLPWSLTENYISLLNLKFGFIHHYNNILMIRQGLNISSFRGIYTTEKQNYFIRYLLLFSLLFWCAGFFLPAFSLEFTGISFIHFAVKSIYSTVCNQSNTATFSVNDHLLFVCARCTGLYLGAFTAAEIGRASCRERV